MLAPDFSFFGFLTAQFWIFKESGDLFRKFIDIVTNADPSEWDRFKLLDIDGDGIYELLATNIDGEREDYCKWLANNGYKELAAFSNMLQDDIEAEQWLTQNGHGWLGIVSHAIDGDQNSRQWLRENMHPVNLTFALACRGDDKAVSWLKFMHLDILLRLADEVADLRYKQELDTSFPYKMRF